MTATFKQLCPLCGVDAEYCLVDRENRKYFKCPNCTYFQISRRAEEALAERSSARKARYASEAPKAPPEHMLVIRMPDHEHRLASSDVLQAGFVAKAELPLR